MRKVLRFLLLKPILIVLLFSFWLSTESKGQEDKVYNFGFELGNKDITFPVDWFTWGTGYNHKIDTRTKHSGNASIRIEPTEGNASKTFGCIAYLIPAKFEATQVELKAYMKLNNVTGVVGLMLRIDGPGGVLAFEDLESKKIQGTKDWTQFSVTLPLPENATAIYVGASIKGEGQLWVDDFQLLLDGKDIKEAKVKKSRSFRADADKEFDSGSKILKIDLTREKIEDLDLLGKIWGFLKYYHPRVASGEFNWDFELFRIAPRIIQSKSRKERNKLLNDWISAFGKIEMINQTWEQKDGVKLVPDLSWINKASLGTELVRSLNEVKRAKRSEENYYIVRLYPLVTEFKNERSYSHFNYPDTGYRLLCLYRYWNIINYYFPYKNLIGEDWNAILLEYIPKFINAKDESDYKLTVLSLISRIHDTHANILETDNFWVQFKGQKYAPLEIAFVEGKATVVDYFDRSLGVKSGLKIGDIIESVDGKSVEQIISEKLPITPASNYPTQLRKIARNLLRSNKATLKIKYRRSRDTLSNDVEMYYPYYFSNYRMLEKQDTCFKIIDKDISYLYPGTLKKEYLPVIMTHIERTKALIIDYRCYPAEHLIFNLCDYLLPESRPFVKLTSGSIVTPGLFEVKEELKVGYSNSNYFKGKVIVIVNERTQSQAEFHAMALKTVPRVTFIGSTTAGADGDVSKIDLPGGIITMISGVGVYYPDGTDTQRVGIVPDLEVKPTIDGIIRGEDELLKKALKLLGEE